MEDNRIDTDLDSWNTGNDKADIMDDSEYNPEDISDDAREGNFVEDEGDEDDLGTPIKNGVEDIDDISTVDDDVVKLDEEILDDSEYNDNSFDCD